MSESDFTRALARTRGPDSAVRVVADGKTLVELDAEGLKLYDASGDERAVLSADDKHADLALMGGAGGDALLLTTKEGAVQVSANSGAAWTSLDASALGASASLRDAAADLEMSASSDRDQTISKVSLSVPTRDGAVQHTNLLIDTIEGDRLEMMKMKDGDPPLDLTLDIPLVPHTGPELELHNGDDSLAARAWRGGPTLGLSDEDGDIWTSPRRPSKAK